MLPAVSEILLNYAKIMPEYAPDFRNYVLKMTYILYIEARKCAITTPTYDVFQINLFMFYGSLPRPSSVQINLSEPFVKYHQRHALQDHTT